MDGYNIATDIVGDRYVSTAMHPTFIAVLGSYVKTYETFIWEWDGEKRGKWLHEINHANEGEAAKVHGYIVANLRKKEAAEFLAWLNEDRCARCGRNLVVPGYDWCAKCRPELLNEEATE